MVTPVQWSSLTIVPINATDEKDITTFYNGQSSLANKIPNHNILIISGDMNAQIGNDVKL